MTDPRDFIDPDEGRDIPPAFYTEAEPCESCGEPTFRGRIWNQEHELWIATDCSCNNPDAPVCPALLPLIVEAKTVGELLDTCKVHRKNCPQCGPIPIRQTTSKEPAVIERQAA